MKRRIDNLFKAKASNPLEIVFLDSASVGFKIPEYQRQYDWAEKNIDRLFQDTLNGFQKLSTSTGANAFTFLGTLILVNEESKEESFEGKSVAIIDGQQRLTTLALFACALCEALRSYRSKTDFSKIPPEVSRWLQAETDHRLSAFREFVIGSPRVSSSEVFPFPRIVRDHDTRANTKPNSDYRSPIGKFLDGFATYLDSNDKEYKPPALDTDADKNAQKLTKNYQIIQNLVKNLNNAAWYEDAECEQFDIKVVHRRQFRDLLERLPDYIRDEGEQHQAIQTIIKPPELQDLIRTLLFSAYFCNYIVLMRVITEDESAAFDIFDALNTTGEPLTALETLKPRVISFEKKKSGYAGSESESAFNDISEYLDKRYLKTSDKQTETKELVVTFALYLEGRKLSKDLASQRDFLRKSYDTSSQESAACARKYITSLAETAQFRRYYWERGGIEELGRFHGAETLDNVQLLVSLIRDMNTSLALPILLRYWTPHLKNNGDASFLDVLRAVAAFVVIRRAATGATGGIDSDFRAIMRPKVGRGASRKFGLCAGVKHENDILSLDKLKKALRTLLEHKLKSLDKSKWVESVVANPLYSHSKDLARFMILSAGHQAVPSTLESGTWNKTGIKASQHENRFLTWDTWRDECYATVEHIAPETQSGNGWPPDLYQNNILRHSIGNLILLPAKENSAIGNDRWAKKKKFYLALTERSEDEQRKRFEEAKAEGFSFSNNTKNLLEGGNRLPLLDPLRDVNEWNSEVVSRRGRNIAELCWDIVWPWLN